MVMGGDSCSKVVGSNPRPILDGLFSHILVVKIIMMFV